MVLEQMTVLQGRCSASSPRYWVLELCCLISSVNRPEHRYYRIMNPLSLCRTLKSHLAGQNTAWGKSCSELYNQSLKGWMGPIPEHVMRMRPPKHEVQLLLLFWVKTVAKKKKAKLLCRCLHVVIGTPGLSYMHNLGNETLFLKNLSVKQETSWRKNESTFQKYPPKVPSKHFLAGIHISVWAAKGWVPPEAEELFQRFFSLCRGSIKCFMGAHNTFL